MHKKAAIILLLVAILSCAVAPLVSAQTHPNQPTKLLGTYTVTAYTISYEGDFSCQSKIPAKGLNNNYCSNFLSDIILQGSGYDKNNRFIQINWNKGRPTTPSNTYFIYVPYITGASGIGLYNGISIATDPSYIPTGTWVYIDSVGWRRADDTGGAIRGQRIDIFMPGPRSIAINFGKRTLKVWK